MASGERRVVREVWRCNGTIRDSHAVVSGVMKRATQLLFVVLAALGAGAASAQPQVSYITPDAGAPGMCVAVEIVGPAGNQNNFGQDQLWTTDSVVYLPRPSDRKMVRLGPTIVSWNEQLIQQMILIEPNIPSSDTFIYLAVHRNGQSTGNIMFRIIAPIHLGVVSGGGTLGSNPFVPRTPANTMIVDSMILQNGTYTISQSDPDLATPGNQAFLPIRILSKGPVRLINATLSVDGQSGSTKNYGGTAGPGGGGGGAGYPGVGGSGFTGGGGDNDGSSGNGGVGTGSTTGSPAWVGGSSLNGVTGGGGEQHSSGGGDDGGGGGTGHPFGSSGASGTKGPSSNGGLGGASGGGSSTDYLTNYGGGGGGNYNPGGNGGGQGTNAGQTIGNFMLVPLAGGGGGGAGNVTYVSFFGGAAGGSGGGGGGALDLTSFADAGVANSTISAKGGNGSNGVGGISQTAAGGGGGAGGSIDLSARDSIVIASNSSFSVSGGSSGSGQNSGGNGSIGSVRINGYVSKLSGAPSSSAYFNRTKDYTGPTIQRVSFSHDSVLVHGYAKFWDTVPSGQNQLELFYSWSTTNAWLDIYPIFTVDPASHSARWDAVITPISTVHGDTEIYLVAVQEDQLADNPPYQYFPVGVMSHTGAMISKVLAPPIGVVSPPVIDFGNVQVDSCRDTVVTVRSIGGSDLLVDSASIFGPDAKQFSVQSFTPRVLHPGDSMKIRISFCPDSAACFSGTGVHIYTDAAILDVAIRGCGVQPKAIVKPLLVDFGAVHVGSCEDTSVKLLNLGTATLTVTRETILDPHFTITDVLPIVVKAGDSAVLHLRFCPTDTSHLTATDTIISNAPQSPILLTLKGQGKTGVFFAPLNIDFGEVRRGECKDSSFYVYNLGNDTLEFTVQAISVPVFMVVAPATPYTLTAHDSVLVTVQFCARDTGAFSDSLLINSPVPGQWKVNLFGRGGIGILSMVDTIDFGSVVTGACRDTNITVSNIGNDSLVLAPNSLFKPPFSYIRPDPLRLAAGQKTTITVRFCPTDTNAVSETVGFDTVITGISHAYTLLGNGIQGSLATSGPVDLGCIDLGSTKTGRVFLRNTGNAALTNIVASIGATSTTTIVHNPPSTLPVGASDSVVFIVSASSIGPITGTLTLTWNAGSAPLTLPITGHMSLPPKITTFDSTLVFDTTKLDDSSVMKCVTITNYSCTPIHIDSLRIRTSLSGEFILVSSTALTVSDSIPATICFQYKPRRSGTDSAVVWAISGTDSAFVAKLSGTGAGNAIGIQLAVDTVSGRPGDVVKVPVRAINDVTAAGITSVTFRITFNPMQLDLRTNTISLTSSIIPAYPLAQGATYSVNKHSLGDWDVTATFGSALTGKPVIAQLPFEILLPTASSAAIHLATATFGTALATLASSSDGLVQIQQCDTAERIVVQSTPVSIAQNNPNPFNPVTTIHLDVHFAGHVTIEVDNVLGVKVMMPFDDDVREGPREVHVDASSLPSGAYRYITTWTGNGPTLRDEKTMVVTK